MTNRYYNETFAAAIGQLAKSQSFETQFAGIEDGFDLIQDDIDTYLAIRRFTQLLDCPASYSGSALKLVRVNAGQTGLEFAAAGQLTINTIGGTSYTLVSSDSGALVVSTNGAAVTVTVPPDVYAAGEIIMLNQKGGGQVTFAPGSGVSIRSSDNLLSTRAQYAQVALVALGSNEFFLIGERNAVLTGVALLAGGNTFTGAQTVNYQSLTDGATISTDASLSNHFKVTLGGNRTLANPTNMRQGGIYNWRVKQDATGSRTLAYGSKFTWPGGTVPTLTTTANAVDLIVGQYDATDDKIMCVCTKDFR